MSNKRNRNTKPSNILLQKSNTLLKTMNRELALNLQKVKKDLNQSSTQIASLKAELYDVLTERNALLEKNMKYYELLKTVQVESVSIEKRIREALDQKDLERDRLSTKQSAMICPMVSGYVIHNPKVELRRLNFNEYSDTTEGNDGINLSPILEEKFIENVIPRRLGHRICLSQNISAAGNGEVGEESFYSGSSCRPIPLENINSDGDLLYSEMNSLDTTETVVSSSVPSESNSPPFVSDEAQQPGSSNNQIEANSKSQTRLSVDENKRSTDSGKNSSDGTRNSTTLLTINLLSPQNDPQSSSIPVNPSVFVNVFPRKRAYNSNDGLNIRRTKEETNDGSQDTNNIRIIDFKEPIILLERHPVISERSFDSSLGHIISEDSDQWEVKPDISQCKVIENKRKTKVSSKRRLTVKSEGVCTPEKFAIITDTRPRRSCRNRKLVNYRD